MLTDKPSFYLTSKILKMHSNTFVFRKDLKRFYIGDPYDDKYLIELRKELKRLLKDIDELLKCPF